MLERSFEILIRLCATTIFGDDWHLQAEQLSLKDGRRIDFLFRDGGNMLHVVEVKKGRATPAAVVQVQGYAFQLRNMKVAPTPIVPWVVAHEIPVSLEERASSQGVRTRAISIDECQALVTRHGITVAELAGQRREGKAVYGGGTKLGLHTQVDLETALAEMPAPVADELRKMRSALGFTVEFGKMQAVVFYKGVKLGGINRKHRGGVAYITTGIVLSPATEDALIKFGFRRMTKIQQPAKHEHVWWETPWNNVEGFQKAIDYARLIVDSALLDTI